MGFSGKNWYTRYIEYKKKSWSNIPSLNNPAGNQPDLALYKIAQPSGIMYGHPVIPHYLNDPSLGKLEMEERIKIVLLENLMQGAALKTSNIDEKEYEDFLRDFSSQVIDYYQNIFPDIRKKGKTIWGKQKSSEQVAEGIINERIFIRSNLFEDFWSRFFHNSLLFIDVYFFKEWIDRKDRIISSEEISSERDRIRLMLLKLIAAAANADEVIQSEEKRLYNIFLKSANLPPELEKEAKHYLEDKVTLQDIEFPELKSWILKKYFLELAILTIWADKEVADEERAFLEELRLVLGFTKEELETSFVAIESFVLENWDEVHFFQSKNSYQIVGQLFVKRLSTVAIKNKDRIATEIRESRELMKLLNASRNRKLSAQEKEIVRQQLIDILKVLPTFVIIALPGTFITLPILLKILPKSAFPSAFQD